MLCLIGILGVRSDYSSCSIRHFCHLLILVGIIEGGWLV